MTHDAVLGTLVLANGATVSASGALPAGVTNIAVHNGTLYGITDTNTLKALGSAFPLTASAALANIVAPADRDAGSVFVGGYLVSNGSQLVAGYTRSGAGYPGNVMVFEVSDAGVRYVNAPGNFTVTSVGSLFLVNGTGLDTLSGGPAIYALSPTAAFSAFTFATFPGSGNSSGLSATAGNGVLLLGYADMNFSNEVRAIAPAAYQASLDAGTPLALSGTSVFSGYDLMDLSATNAFAILTRGGFDMVTYDPYTTSVEKLALTPSAQSVMVGSPVKIIDAPNRCTRVLWTVGSGTNLYVGVQDKNGRRLLKLSL